MNLALTWRKNWPDVRAALGQGWPSFVWERSPEGLVDGVPVFCYHVIDDRKLETDLQFLSQNGYRTLTATSLLEVLSGEAEMPDRAVVLTVDDGAHNLYETIFPALQQHDFHAIAFVAPAFHRERYDVPDDRRPCTWDELREMQQSGHVNVQAHTWSHRYIPNWPEPLDLAGIDPAYSRAIQQAEPLTLEADLAKAKLTLEDALGSVIAHLAFPMYEGTADAVRLAQSLGYQSFWWGTKPGRKGNRPGTRPTGIVRLSAEFIRRLPGDGRISLKEIAQRRFR